MKRYWTSDLHFSHARVIDYCKRPYKDVTEMNNAIVAEWNRVVNPEDTVYVLGDFSLNPKVAEEYTPKLNGTKILVHGNHCATYPYVFGRVNKKQDKMRQRYLAAGWSLITDEMTVTLKNGRDVLMSHLPYASAVKYDKRYMNMRPKDTGLFLLHGHLHAKYLKNNNMIDVGWDQKHTLFAEDEIISLIDNKEKFIYSWLYPKPTLWGWIKSLFVKEKSETV
jgi:calcineurin-like phosphoesterase family protein